MIRNIIFSLASIFLFGAVDVDKLDRQTKTLLPSLNSNLAFDQIPLEDLRHASSSDPMLAKGVASIKNMEISGMNGPFGIRIYTPNTKAPYPVFLFFHGGGWVLGSIDDYDSFCQEFCRKVGCLVVSVDYHLAPEHPFPKPLEDCYFAAQWVEEHIAEYGGNPAKIAVGGDSAGGNLTAAVTLMARDNKKPSLIYQVLLCPATNCNYETVSYYEFAEGYYLTKDHMKFFWYNYLQSADPTNIYASPLLAPSLAGLPPACIIVADFDPLRDDGLMYGIHLEKSGVPTIVKNYNSIHGFYGFGQLALSKEALSFVAKQLKEKFQE